MSSLFASPDHSPDHSPTPESATAFPFRPSLIVEPAQESYSHPFQWSFSPPACVDYSTAFIENEAAQQFQGLPTNVAYGLATVSTEGLVPSTTTYCETDTNDAQQELSHQTHARTESKIRKRATRKYRAKSPKTKLNNKAGICSPVDQSETVKYTTTEGLPGGRKKWVGVPLPKSFTEMTGPDAMVWKWRNAGRGWKEIRAEWERMTGHYPANSTLSVRYMKINDMMANQGAATDVKLCEFKKEAEEELANELWDRVAAKMIAYHPNSEHNPRSLKMRYDNLVRSGFHKKRRLAEDAAVTLEATGTSTTSLDKGADKTTRYDWTDNAITTPDVSMLDQASRMLLQQMGGMNLPFALPHRIRPEDEVAESSRLLVSEKPLVDYDSDE